MYYTAGWNIKESSKSKFYYWVRQYWFHICLFAHLPLCEKQNVPKVASHNLLYNSVMPFVDIACCWYLVVYGKLEIWSIKSKCKLK